MPSGHVVVIHVIDHDFGPLAQQAEHRTFNPQVPGSIPGRPTTYAPLAQLDRASAF